VQDHFGQHGFYASTLEYSDMVLSDGDAYLLLSYLKMHNGPFAPERPAYVPAGGSISAICLSVTKNIITRVVRIYR
jgi:hypothetical protein